MMAVPGDPWQGGTRGRGWRQLRTEHREALADGVAHVSEHWLASVFVCLSLAVALAVPALLLIVEDSLAAQLQARSGAVAVHVYLQPGVSGRDAQPVWSRIQKMPEVERVEPVSPEQALAELEAAMGVDLGESLGGENPIPESARVYLGPMAGSAGEARLVERMRSLDAVDAVVSDRGWRERLEALVAFVARLGWLLGVLLALAAVMIAHASVRMAIDERLAEIRVYALLGAERAALRRPFVYLGVLYGCGGGVLAAMVLSAALLVLEAPLARLTDSYGTAFALTGFDLAFVCLVLGVALALGTGGALLAAVRSIRRAAEAADW